MRARVNSRKHTDDVRTPLVKQDVLVEETADGSAALIEY